MKLLIPAELIIFLEPDTANLAENISHTFEKLEKNAESALDSAFDKAQAVVSGLKFN